MAPGSRSDADNDPLRRAAQYRVDREAASAAEDPAGSPGPDRTGEADDANEEKKSPGSMSAEERSRYVDVVVDQAMRRGEFDNLPLHGKPIPGLTGTHDPDWWVKGLIERENITGVLPSAQLRKDDAELDGRLDLETMEQRVREVVADFNARVVDVPAPAPGRSARRDAHPGRRRGGATLGGAARGAPCSDRRPGPGRPS
jgi:hypothetical protein